jgi:serine/threonine protein kinase/DNA-directed RNA polymerase subunit RPC12/RpoP
MTAPFDCPFSKQLQVLDASPLSPDQRGECERHLESCTVCQVFLDQAEQCGDELRNLCRQFGDSTEGPRDLTLDGVVERLYEVKSPIRTKLVEPADLNFLRPTDRPEFLGTLDEYEVEEVIGQGGMGVVLRAYEPALHRSVAIKVLSPFLAGNLTARRRFTREAQAAAAVSHDHIVPIHGVRETEGLPYLIMQFVAGESLQACLDRGGPLEMEEVVRIGLQTASGLAAAHARGLIHRDIKPANLLLEQLQGPSGAGEARVKITDFGLARMVNDVHLTQNGVIAGTPEYMSPEQARGEPVDHRTDLFSLGSLLYALCTGVPPFSGSSAVAVLVQVSEEAPLPLRSRNPAISVWLETLIHHLMAKRPADRIQSAAEVSGLLDGYLAHLHQPRSVSAPRLPPLPTNDSAGPSATTARKEGGRRLSRRSWSLRLLFLTALGPALFLLAQVARPPEQDQPPKEPFPSEVYQDFRGDKPLISSLTPDGPDFDALARPEDRGLRFTLPPTRSHIAPVGVAMKVGISGDFEITGTYELLTIDQPLRGHGVGVALNIGTKPDIRNFAKVGHFLRVGDGSVYLAETWDKDTPDAYQIQWLPTAARTGQLRLERVGSQVKFLVAEGPGDDFKELLQRDFGKEDVELVRFVVNNNGSPAGVDALLVDLKVRFGSPAPIESTAAPGERKGWTLRLPWLAVPLLLLVLGAWLSRRKNGTAATLAPASDPQQLGPSEEAPASVSFGCAVCGQNLLARAELTGKQIKCPRCGKATVVPVTRARPGLRLPCVVTALMVGMFHWGAGVGRTEPQEQAREWQLPLRGTPENREGWQLIGPDAERCLKFEPEGLRITLPAGYPGERPGTGLRIPLSVRGDFEATIRYEILTEPEQEKVGPRPTKLTFQAQLDRRDWTVAGLARRVTSDRGTQFTTWTIRDNHDNSGTRQTKARQHPAQAKAGRLRIVRTGSEASFYAAEGPEADFTLLAPPRHLGEEGLKSIELVGSTGFPNAMLDVRFTDLHVLANSAVAATPKQEQPQPRRSPRVALPVLATLLALLVLGVWLWWRRRDQTEQALTNRDGGADQPTGPLEPIAFRCSTCARGLKAPAPFGGKKVTCPHCGSLVCVPRPA